MVGSVAPSMRLRQVARRPRGRAKAATGPVTGPSRQPSRPSHLSPPPHTLTAVIRIPLTPAVVARIRFAISPLSELVALLTLIAEGKLQAPYARWGAEATRVLADRDLVLLT